MFTLRRVHSRGLQTLLVICLSKFATRSDFSLTMLSKCLRFLGTSFPSLLQTKDGVGATRQVIDHKILTLCTSCSDIPQNTNGEALRVSQRSGSE